MMRTMPRVYRNFEEFEQAELNCRDEETGIDQMLDEMFADELDIDFKSKTPVEIPEIISILPLRNSVLFPGSIIPIDVGRRKSVRLVEEAIAKERPVIGILTQRDARTEDPGEGDMYTIGCAARILKVIKLAKDNFSVILQGVSRIRIQEHSQQEPF